MKALKTTAIAAIFLTITGAAFASHQLGFKSAYKTKVGREHLVGGAPATDITIVNNTGATIRAGIPGYAFYPVDAYAVRHFYNDTWYGQTEIALSDNYGNVFFDDVVGRLAAINVYGSPANYSVTVTGG